MTNCLSRFVLAFAVFAIRLAFCGLAVAGEGQQPGTMSGGKVARAIVSYAKGGPSDRGWFEFEVAEVFLEGKSVFDGKRIGITVFVSIRAKDGSIDSFGPFGAEALVNSGFQSLGAKGGGELPPTLPAGKYNLIVTVLGQVEGERQRILDVDITDFDVPTRDSGR